MLVIRVGLFGWIFEMDFGKPPAHEDDEIIHVPDPEMEFGFRVPPVDEAD